VEYVYDGDGQRVKKSSGRLYWGAGPLAESDANGTLVAEYVFVNGQRAVRRDVSTGTMHYYFLDHLGSATVVANSSGTIENESDYLPFGEENAFQNSTEQHFKFTGKERDAETGLDYFGARYYGSSMGRWMSPDWSNAPGPVPYAEFSDPQTLNLYGYVRNNPLSQADADGHCYPLCTMAIGAGLGALTGGGAEYLRQQIRGESTDWSKIGHAALGGGFAGAIAGVAGPEAGLGAKVVFGALGSGIGGAVERSQNGENPAQPTKIAIDVVAGIAGGAAEKGVEKLIPAAAAGTTVTTAAGGGYTATFKTEASAAAENVVRNTVRTTTNAVVQTATGTAANLVKDHVNTTPTPPPPQQQRIELMKSH